MWKKCRLGLSKYSSLVFWILKSLWLLFVSSPAPTEQTYLLVLPSSSEDILLRDTSRIFSSALRRVTKSCWNYSNRWAVSMEIKPRFPDEAFYSMVPITENPCGWPCADMFTLRIQSQAAISQQRLWLSFIFLKESQTFESLHESINWRALFRAVEWAFLYADIWPFFVNHIHYCLWGNDRHAFADSWGALCWL